MSFQNKIERSPPEKGQKQVIKEQARVLDNQINHLLDVYAFMNSYRSLGIQPDELHRVLFDMTSLTPQGFKIRMTKASGASEILGSMLQTNDYFGDMRENLSTDEFSRNQLTVILESLSESDLCSTISEQDREYYPDFQGILGESIEQVRSEDMLENLSEFYSQLDSNTFYNISNHFNKMSDWYESVLLEEGLITEGKTRTPSFPVLVALCIIYITGLLMIAIGYHEEDAFKILTGMQGLAMGVLAFAAL